MPSYAARVETEAFLAFVDQAHALLAKPDTDSPAFDAFVGDARRLLLREIEHELDQLRRAGALIRRWTGEHDLIDIAGMCGWEDPITELLRWALSPGTHADSALDRQHAVLSLCGWEVELPREPVEPVTQRMTRAGAFIDLDLDFPERAVVVEAKWFSEEHNAAQTGQLQTIHYAEAAQAELRGAGEPLVVYLTPNGRPPAGIGRAVMHAQVAFALARALDAHAEQLPHATRETFRIVFGHLFRWGTETNLLELEAAASRASDRAAVWSSHDIENLLGALRVLRPFIAWSGTS